jgi:hypothetical protein
VNVAAPFDGQELVYRSGPYRLERDPYASLVAPPAALLAAVIRERLLRAGFVRKEGEAGDERMPDLLMDVEVRELSGDFVNPEEPVGVVVIGFEVSAAGSRPPLFRKLYVRRTPLPHRTADAVVTALNQGLGDMMGELERDLEAALARAVSRGP